MAIVWILGKLIVAIAIAALALNIRTPLLASWRSPWVIVGLFAVSGLLIGWELRRFARNRVQQVGRWSVLAVAIAALSIASTNEVKFHWAKHRVLAADPAQLAKLGEHFIVGYRDFDEVAALVKRGAVGGVFLTRRNVDGKTVAQIRETVDRLQAMRRDRNLPPLWIATDQEGGVVSRLSPPLPAQPSLGDAIANYDQATERQQAAARYARTQAAGLAAAGVNLNLAPVVDLNKGIRNPEDKYSRIYQRAIAASHITVTQVALTYCQELDAAGIRCTLKHFPGLGRVETDTHVARASLSVPLEILRQDDWRPFNQVTQILPVPIMLSHLLLTELDAKHPVSFSKAAIRDLLRRDWQYDGLLLTDDLCMKAAYGSDAGVEGATFWR